MNMLKDYKKYAEKNRLFKKFLIFNCSKSVANLYVYFKLIHKLLISRWPGGDSNSRPRGYESRALTG